jgi:hypothetical protein
MKNVRYSEGVADMDGDVTQLRVDDAAAGNKRTRERDRQKFKTLANKRVSKALQTIQLIGNLSNRSNYDYTQEDVTKIVKALTDEVSACRKKFEMALNKQSKPAFELE